MMTPNIASLPPELYSAILDQVPYDSLQATTLALTRALPLSPIPRHHLYKNVSLKASPQVFMLWKKVAQSKDGKERAWVQRFAFRGWAVDPDVLNNLLDTLLNVRVLTVNVGTTFSPEHLEDMFRNPRPDFQALSLCFRIYFDTPTYGQFLKGAYFDSTLSYLSKWPANPRFTTLSIVQEPPPAIIHTPDGRILGPVAFAQPIVFLSLDPLSTYAKSPLSRHITSLRFRLPMRNIWHKFCVGSSSFPSVRILDMSTSLVNGELALTAIVNTFNNLEHLILDQCGLCANGREQGGWRNLGKLIPMAGIKKARDKEREVKASQSHSPSVEAAVPSGGGLRVPIRAAAFPLANTHPPTLSLLPDSTTPRPRVLPPRPRLRTLCAAVTGIPPTDEQRKEWLRDFEEGWREGISRLKDHWHRALTFGRTSNVHVLMFKRGYVAKEGDDSMAALEELEDPEELMHGEWEQPPILCFGLDTDHDNDHAPGCGHTIARDIWPK